MSEGPLIFSGKTALVTGGSRGIGRAIVRMLAAEGAAVAFTYKSRDDAAQELVAEIVAAGGRCAASRVDVGDFAAVKDWVAESRSAFGSLDILVNNAGIVMDKALMLMTPEDWQQVITTNLSGMFNAARACIVTFLKQRRGAIVNISSVSGLIGLARQTNYSASKGGMNAFTKALAKEVAAYGVRVNAVAPGYIATEILAGLSAPQQAEILAAIPLGRLGQPEEVARGVRFLLSDEASYLTGQILTMDGGLAIR